MTQLISQFIDDELDLDEKIRFVEEVHIDRAYKELAVDLLRQEKLIRFTPEVQLTPPMPLVRRVKRTRLTSRAGWSLAVVAAAAALILSLLPPQPSPPTGYRFVVYRPEASQVELAGTFTDWQRIPMQRTGVSGYWVLTLPVPPGEHRFSYSVAGEGTWADPTMPEKESDDFGGENSIIRMGTI